MEDLEIYENIGYQEDEGGYLVIKPKRLVYYPPGYLEDDDDKKKDEENPVSSNIRIPWKTILECNIDADKKQLKIANNHQDEFQFRISNSEELQSLADKIHHHVHESIKRKKKKVSATIPSSSDPAQEEPLQLASTTNSTGTQFMPDASQTSQSSRQEDLVQLRQMVQKTKGKRKSRRQAPALVPGAVPVSYHNEEEETPDRKPPPSLLAEEVDPIMTKRAARKQQHRLSMKSDNRRSRHEQQEPIMVGAISSNDERRSRSKHDRLREKFDSTNSSPRQSQRQNEMGANIDEDQGNDESPVFDRKPPPSLLSQDDAMAANTVPRQNHHSRKKKKKKSMARQPEPFTVLAFSNTQLRNHNNKQVRSSETSNSHTTPHDQLRREDEDDENNISEKSGDAGNNKDESDDENSNSSIEPRPEPPQALNVTRPPALVQERVNLLGADEEQGGGVGGGDILAEATLVDEDRFDDENVIIQAHEPSFIDNMRSGKVQMFIAVMVCFVVLSFIGIVVVVILAATGVFSSSDSSGGGDVTTTTNNNNNNNVNTDNDVAVNTVNNNNFGSSIDNNNNNNGPTPAPFIDIFVPNATTNTPTAAPTATPPPIAKWAGTYLGEFRTNITDANILARRLDEWIAAPNLTVTPLGEVLLDGMEVLNFTHTDERDELVWPNDGAREGATITFYRNTSDAGGVFANVDISEAQQPCFAGQLGDNEWRGIRLDPIGLSKLDSERLQRWAGQYYGEVWIENQWQKMRNVSVTPDGEVMIDDFFLADFRFIGGNDSLSWSAGPMAGDLVFHPTLGDGGVEYFLDSSDASVALTSCFTGYYTDNDGSTEYPWRGIQEANFAVPSSAVDHPPNVNATDLSSWAGTYIGDFRIDLLWVNVMNLTVTTVGEVFVNDSKVSDFTYVPELDELSWTATMNNNYHLGNGRVIFFPTIDDAPESIDGLQFFPNLNSSSTRLNPCFTALFRFDGGEIDYHWRGIFDTTKSPSTTSPVPVSAAPTAAPNCEGKLYSTIVNTPETATEIGRYRGDDSYIDFVGVACYLDRSWNEVKRYSRNQGEWFHGTATDDGTRCTGKIEARFVLQVPEGIDYNLFIYQDSPDNLVGETNQAEGRPDEYVLSKHDGVGGGDTFEYWVKVEYMSGDSCDPWTLTVYAHL